MSVKERLIYFAKSKEKSVRKFETKCGLNNGYVNAIRVSIQPDKLRSIALNYTDLNTEWLLTGVGEMLKEAKELIGNDIIMSREVFEQITRLTETILSQQRTIENLTKK